MATQNLSSPVSSEFPQLKSTSKSTNQTLRELSFDADAALPFLTDGFVDRCIAVTDHALLIRWIELEEYRYGAL